MPESRRSYQSDLLKGLTDDEFRRIEERLEIQTVPAGTKLLTQGTWDGRLYLIRDGVLQVEAQGSDGNARRLANLVAGECVGEMSLLTGMPVSATVTAQTDATVEILRQVDFVQLLSSSPGLSRNVSVILSRRLATTIQREEVGFDRAMRVRVHTEIPPELPLQIVHEVARYLAAPLLVVDTRTDSSGAGSVPFEHVLAGGTIEPMADGSRVLLTTMDRLGPEEWARLEAVVAPRMRYILHLSDILDGSSNAGGHSIVRDVTLWPGGAGVAPHGDSDLAVVTQAASRNSRAARDVLAVENGTHVVRAMAPDSMRDIGWIARHLAGMKVGLTLGGGGARGSAHVGILQGLERAGVPIDYLSGCSVGAGLGAGYAYGLSIPELIDMVRSFADSILRYTVPRYSLLSNRGLASFFRQLVGHSTLEELEIPLAIIAADLLRAQTVVMDRGSIWKAVLASTALPGVYPPVWIGDHCLVDGGVVDPVPAAAVRDLGADVILAVRLTKVGKPGVVWTEAVDSKPGDSPLVIQTMQRAFEVMAEEISLRSVRDANVVINVASEPLTIREFREGTKLVPIGEAALAQSWPSIQGALPWLQSVPYPTA